jgi:hypothetical protein
VQALAWLAYLRHCKIMTSTIINVKKSKKGRPPIESKPVTVRMTTDALRALDDWRRKQDDLPGRPEAIRRLVELGVKVKLKG